MNYEIEIDELMAEIDAAERWRTEGTGDAPLLSLVTLTELDKEVFEAVLPAQTHLDERTRGAVRAFRRGREEMLAARDALRAA